MDQMKTNSNKLSLIIQTTLSCNLRCKHCYEADACYPKGNMPFELFEELLSKAKNYNQIQIVWFGGEPTLVGIEFFIKAIDLEKKYTNIKFKNIIQTNGLNLNEDWIDFFIKNEFGVSISFDGCYNQILRDYSDRVEKNIKLCVKKGLKVGILSTIVNQDYKQQIENYEYIKTEYCQGCKFNRIFVSGKNKENSIYDIEDEDYLKSQIDLFEHWIQDSNAKQIVNFTKMLNSIYGLRGRECTSIGCLYKWLCINPFGDIFTCSRFYEDEYKLTSLKNINNLNEIFNLEKYNKIATEAVNRIVKCKEEKCPIFDYCHGGCNGLCKEEFGRLDENKSSLCKFRKKFIPYLIKKMYEISFKEEIIPNKYITKYLSTTNKQIITQAYNVLLLQDKIN